MLTIIVFTVKCCQSGQTQAEYQKKWQKLVKNSHFPSNQNFDLNFSGYDLLVWRWVEYTQTGSKHHIFICWAEKGDSDSCYPLKLARSESDQKSLKNAPKCQISPFYLFWCPCMVKISANYVWNEFWDVLAQKSINRKKIFVFALKNHDFLEIFFGKAKIPRFELRNPIGWAFRVVLALNQWIRPKNGGRKKCTGNV